TPSEHPCHHGDRRHREHEKQREYRRHVDEQHRSEHSHQYGPHRVGQPVADDTVDHCDVVRQTGRELADVAAVEEGDLLTQEVVEHALAEPCGHTLGREI